MGHSACNFSDLWSPGGNAVVTSNIYLILRLFCRPCEVLVC